LPSIVVVAVGDPGTPVIFWAEASPAQDIAIRADVTTHSNLLLIHSPIDKTDLPQWVIVICGAKFGNWHFVQYA
jgi:hypothetical protein